MAGQTGAARPDLKAAMRAALEKKQRAQDSSAGGDEAAQLRKAGNQLFAAHDLKGAEAKYREALGLSLSSAGKSILWSNLSLLRICGGEWQEGLDFATRAIGEDAENVKAHYRRALCGCELGRIDQALSDVLVALTGLDASTPEGVQASELQARIEQLRQGSPRSSIQTEDWEKLETPLRTPPEPAEPALRDAYIEPVKPPLRNDSTTAIPAGSDYFRATAAPGTDRYFRTDRAPEVEEIRVALEKIVQELDVENAWPLGTDEDIAPPRHDVRQIGVVPTVPEPEGDDDDEDDDEDDDAADLEKAKALLAFCDRKREKDADPLMDRWRARWGD